MSENPVRPLDRFRKNLQTLIDAQALTVIQVAEAAKITPKQVYNLLNGSHDPRLKGLEKVAAVFGLSTWQLLAVELTSKPAENKQVLRLLDAFMRADEMGRGAILQVAEIAAAKGPELA